MDAQQIAQDNLIFLALSGSHAYGTSTPTSDMDYRGLFYAPENIYTSAFRTIEQVQEFGGEKDSVVYELKKYIKLLVEQNPNILELLWVDDKSILFDTAIMKELRKDKDFFLSSKAKHTFSGYAVSQLKRIKGHNKWINNPQPKRRPKEVDFVGVVWNTTPNVIWNKTVPFKQFRAFHLGGDIFGLGWLGSESTDEWHDKHEALVFEEGVDKDFMRKYGYSFSLIVKFNRQLYREAVDNWKHYWEWKDNRNQTRSALEEQHGYDTKHASHLIRLLRMGGEILRGEGVKVLRPDAAELTDIRNGKFTYEQIVKQAEDLDNELTGLYTTTKLPHHIDYDKADEILQNLYYMGWSADDSPAIKQQEGIGYKYYVQNH